MTTETKAAGLKITDYPVSTLAEMRNEKNPRWMPDEQMAALQASLSQFGLVEPLIVNTRTKQIVGGHQRLDAAIANEEKTLPVVEVDLDLGSETALNLALNKIRGAWDYEKLATMLADMEPDSLIATGFGEAEAKAIADSFGADDAAAIAIDQLDDGIVRETYNRSESQVKEQFDASEKVQFGMFSLHVPIDTYRAWVEKLKAKSTLGESPAALGMVVADILGIAVSSEESEEPAAPEDGKGEDPSHIVLTGEDASEALRALNKGDIEDE